MVDAIRRSVTHARTPTSSVEQILFRILPRPEIVRGHPFEPSSHFRGLGRGTSSMVLSGVACASAAAVA